MIGLNRRRTMGNALPYDAEIEYLESTGTQWVDTGVSIYGWDDFSLEMEIIPTRLYNWQHLFSLKLTGNDSSFQEIWIDSSGYLNVRFKNYKLSTSNRFVVDDKISFKYDYNQDTISLYVNGTLNNTIAGNKGEITVADSVKLLNRTTYSYVKFFRFSLHREGVAVLDIIPVRVGQVGYMYEKVSGQLFGNSGTGNFILGNDVNSVNVVSQAKQREMLNNQFETL